MEGTLQTHASEWFGKESSSNVISLSSVWRRHSPFLKTLTETGSSVTADLGMERNDSLESVTCLGLHDSDVSCYQSDCVVHIHFRDVSDCYCAYGVAEERLQRQVLGPRVPMSWIWNSGGRESRLRCLLKDLSLGVGSVILSKIQFKKQSVHVSLVGKPWRRSSWAICSAVYAVEAAHRRQLSVRRVLANSDQCWFQDVLFPRSATIGDV